MPEGPSIVLLRKQVARFEGLKILRARARRDRLTRLAGRKSPVRIWGKHFLIELPKVSVRVHFLMFGSYTIDSRKERQPRLQLAFRKGEINLYSCAVQLLEGPLDEAYDWRSDVSDAWDGAAARRRIRKQRMHSSAMRCSTRTYLPASATSSRTKCCSGRVCIPCPRSARCLRRNCVRWRMKRANTASSFLNGVVPACCASTGSCTTAIACPECGRPLVRAWLGETNRRSFFCTACRSAMAPGDSPGAQRPERPCGRAKRPMNDRDRDRSWSITRHFGCGFSRGGNHLSVIAASFAASK